MAEMLLRKPIFPGDGHIHQVQLIFAAIGLPDVHNIGFPLTVSNQEFLTTRCNFGGVAFSKLFPKISADGAALLETLLTVNPFKRATAKTALTHAFFKKTLTLYDYASYESASMTSEYFEFDRGDFDCSKLVSLVVKEVASFVEDGETDDKSSDSASRDSGDTNRAQVQSPADAKHTSTTTATTNTIAAASATAREISAATEKDKTTATNPHVLEPSVEEKNSVPSTDFEVTILPNGTIQQQSQQQQQYARSKSAKNFSSKSSSSNPFRTTQKVLESATPSVSLPIPAAPAPLVPTSITAVLPKVRVTNTGDKTADRSSYRASNGRLMPTSTMTDRFSLEAHMAASAGIDARDTITSRRAARGNPNPNPPSTIALPDVQPKSSNNNNNSLANAILNSSSNYNSTNTNTANNANNITGSNNNNNESSNNAPFSTSGKLLPANMPEVSKQKRGNFADFVTDGFQAKPLFVSNRNKN